MTPTHIAYKEWAIAVQALGRGGQILSLRKGGVQETNGRFQVQQPSFWLFPTQFHEAEESVIPSYRPALRALAANARTDVVRIEFFAVTAAVYRLTDWAAVRRLHGRHLWSESVLAQRFHFGREPGLVALVLRVYRRPAPLLLPVLPAYGGCKSWIELPEALPAADLVPVLDNIAFARHRDEIAGLLRAHRRALFDTPGNRQ